MVELVTALVLGLLACRLPNLLAFLGFAWAALAGVALSFIDIRVHRLPNRLVVGGLIGLGASLVAQTLIHGTWSRQLTAALCMTGTMLVYLVLALIPRGYGLGDVKASALTGVCAGWYGVGSAALALSAGLILTGLAAITAMILNRNVARGSLAHGPFMFAGALLAVVVFGGRNPH